MVIYPPNEIAFTLFDSFNIYWYGIIMAIAILVGFLSADFFSKFRGFSKGFIIDNSFILIFIGLLGARLYYCILNFPYYFKNPLLIFNFREGGLSLHGMLISGILVLFYLAKKYKFKIFNLLDVFSVVLPLSQSIGRWGNFFNSEAFGFPTYSNWGLFVPVHKRPIEYVDFSLFHPTFLYESILDLVLFVILVFLIKKTKTPGIIFALYLILYSIIRIIVEYFRVDSALYLFSYPVAQVVSMVFIAIGILVIFRAKKFDF